MGRPPNTDGRQTRVAILEAALDLFAEKGYFGTSLREISTAVGVRESALYNYFSSKEALFDALLLADREEKLDRFSSVLAPPVTDIRRVLEQFATTALEMFCAPRQQKLYRILMSDGVRLARAGRLNLFERLDSGRHRLDDLMQRLVRDGWLRAENPRVLAMEFLGPLLLWRQLHTVGPVPRAIKNRQTFARRHVDHFLIGAAPRPSHARTRSRKTSPSRVPRHGRTAVRTAPRGRAR